MYAKDQNVRLERNKRLIYLCFVTTQASGSFDTTYDHIQQIVIVVILQGEKGI